MTPLAITAFDLAQRYVGIREFAGEKDHPLIRWWHSLCTIGEQPDEVPWCSSFANGMAWELRLPRSKSALARSWLEVGQRVALEQAEVGFDVVILKRGQGNQPGPENTTAPGHVGFYAGHDDTFVELLGGNQGDSVSVARYPVSRILGIRRLL
jgi:uncharacterized protein (TIGR02594 family)